MSRLSEHHETSSTDTAGYFFGGFIAITVGMMILGFIAVMIGWLGKWSEKELKKKSKAKEIRPNY